MNLSLRLIAYALVFVGAADAPLFAAEKSAKPNLVIILADDQGWGDLSLNGNTNLRTGDYDAAVHYTCPEADAGSAIELSFNGSKLEGKVSPAWNPPLLDKQDRAPRKGESIMKEFHPLNVGMMRLEKGRGPLTLRALQIPGKQVMDVRLVTLTLMKKL